MLSLLLPTRVTCDLFPFFICHFCQVLSTITNQALEGPHIYIYLCFLLQSEGEQLGCKLTSDHAHPLHGVQSVSLSFLNESKIPPHRPVNRYRMKLEGLLLGPNCYKSQELLCNFSLLMTPLSRQTLFLLP